MRIYIPVYHCHLFESQANMHLSVYLSYMPTYEGTSTVREIQDTIIFRSVSCDQPNLRNKAPGEVVWVQHAGC